MPWEGSTTTFRTLDGLHLAGTFVIPEGQRGRAVVMIHGGGVTREEGGFFRRLASGLGDAGVASLRFDLRGHGESEGRQEELTRAAILNDIRVAFARVRETQPALSRSACLARASAAASAATTPPSGPMTSRAWFC